MKHADKRDFAELLAGLHDIYGRTLTPASIGLWWAAFERYDLTEVASAFSRYTQDPDQGRYPPTPASVLASLAAASGCSRPAADEAWAMALESFDESATVCLTDEMLEAVAVAAPVWETGDKVGARMAFKSAYDRIVAGRRAEGHAPSWSLSLGWDGAKRERAAQDALRLGRLPLEKVRQYLPAPAPRGVAAAVAGLLTGNVVQFPVDDDAMTRRRLAELKDIILSAGNKAPDHDPVAERDQFQVRKREALEALARLERGTADAAERDTRGFGVPAETTRG